MNNEKRIQLNLRLDGHKELYEAVKDAAARQDTSVNSFVITALKAALGWSGTNGIATTEPALEAVIEAILAAKLDELLESKLNKMLSEKLGESAA